MSHREHMKDRPVFMRDEDKRAYFGPSDDRVRAVVLAALVEKAEDAYEEGHDAAWKEAWEANDEQDTHEAFVSGWHAARTYYTKKVPPLSEDEGKALDRAYKADEISEREVREELRQRKNEEESRRRKTEAQPT